MEKKKSGVSVSDFDYDRVMVDSLSRYERGSAIGPHVRKKLLAWFAGQPEAVQIHIMGKFVNRAREGRDNIQAGKMNEFVFSKLILGIMDIYKFTVAPRRKGKAEEYEMRLSSELRKIQARDRALKGTGKKPAAKKEHLRECFSTIEEMREQGDAWKAVAEYVNKNVAWFARSKKRNVSWAYLRQAYYELKMEMGLADGLVSNESE